MAGRLRTESPRRRSISLKDPGRHRTASAMTQMVGGNVGSAALTDDWSNEAQRGDHEGRASQRDGAAVGD